MGKGQISNKISCNTIVVFFNESSNVFSLKDSKHILNKGFEYLITCEKAVFDQFLKYLGKDRLNQNYKLYSHLEMKKIFQDYLFKSAATIHQHDFNKAS